MRWGPLTALWLLATSSPAWAWGEDAHRWFAEHALDALPISHCFRIWWEQNKSPSYLDASVDPDRWRSPQSPSYRPDEAAQHHLYLQQGTSAWALPRTWDKVVAQSGSAKALSRGRVPWKVEEVRAGLK